ncbi:hypothetical protein JTB14_008749 [Gonioctena quinquepunctata]|nr:hypothetical protein JTB14_008749 [Gonioctena quinquepunctata]
MILSNGRNSMKQYNAKKPMKRGFKLRCQADQNAYVSDFEVYHGKNEQIEEEFKSFGLGERTVLSLRQPDWDKYKIIYTDNYFMSINPAQKGCGVWYDPAGHTRFSENDGGR